MYITFKYKQILKCQNYRNGAQISVANGCAWKLGVYIKSQYEVLIFTYIYVNI